LLDVRIALVSTPFVAVPPPEYGGTELVVHALCRALARAGHDVVVFATGDSRVPALRAMFEAPVWPPDPYAELLHCRFAADEIARGGFDVVHSHAAALLALADRLPAPVVHTLHHPVEPTLTRYYERIPHLRAVAISERQAELAAPSPCAVVHHGLEPDLYPLAGPGGDEAFFLGRLSWCKGPELAVEAARQARLPLVIAGLAHEDDPCPRGWREEVLAPALSSPHVRWIKGADLAAKRRLFARARALLVPLRWEEPFGLVLIEALLAGCPVIAFPRGAAPEIIDDGETGFLVRGVGDMASALRRAQRLDRRRIQAQARERFSADRMAAEYVQVYRAAIAEHARWTRADTDRMPEEGWTTLVQ
jgi:glycosyltransferase involved in cell wall biosynthesis